LRSCAAMGAIAKSSSINRSSLANLPQHILP
jgi:hypothetical protein